MKKFLGLAAFVLLCTSCLQSGYFEVNFVGLSGFNYTYSGSQFPDSVLILKTGIADLGTYMSFNSKSDEEQSELYGGFAFSMKKDSSLVIKPENKYPMLTVYTNPLTSASNLGSVVDGFIVYYDSAQKPEHAMEFIEAANGTCTPSYFMVTNTQPVVKYFADRGYAQFADTENDGTDSPADRTEYVKLKATGYLNGSKTGEAEYVLASADSVNVSWKAMPLDKLGKIDTIDLELETSAGSDIPRYVCIDNFVASIYIKK